MIYNPPAVNTMPFAGSKLILSNQEKSLRSQATFCSCSPKGICFPRRAITFSISRQYQGFVSLPICLLMQDSPAPSSTTAALGCCFRYSVISHARLYYF